MYGSETKSVRVSPTTTLVDMRRYEELLCHPRSITVIYRYTPLWQCVCGGGRREVLKKPS
jgi:hypothetical protein